MKWIAVAGLMLFAGNCRAIDLFCEGDAYLGGDRGAASFLLVLDERTLEISSWTPDGVGSGVASISREIYTGSISSQSGVKYWLNLNRYNGDFILLDTREAPHGNSLQVVFKGICRKKTPLF